MALPDNLRPGTTLTQGYLNALRDTARRGNIQVAGAGLSAMDTPGGMLVNLDPEPESLENCARMYYSGTQVLLPFSLVRIYEGDDHVPTIDVADYSGRRRLGILREGAAQGDCPWVQYQGITRVIWDGTTIPAEWIGCPLMALAGMRLGARMHSPYAQWDANGPLLIVNQSISPAEPYSVDSTTTAGSANDSGLPANTMLATVKIDVPFAGAVFCSPVAYAVRAGVIMETGLGVKLPADFGMAYRCWNFGPNFYVHEIAPGDIAV